MSPVRYENTHPDPLRFRIPRLHDDLSSFQTIHRDRHGQVHELDAKNCMSDSDGLCDA